MRQIERRLAELEQSLSMNKGRKFFVFDKSAYDADFVLEAEIDALRRDNGMRDDDELTIVSWRIVDPADCAESVLGV